MVNENVKCCFEILKHHTVELRSKVRSIFQYSRELTPYYDQRSVLVEDNGLAFLGEWLVVISSLRKEMLDKFTDSTLVLKDPAVCQGRTILASHEYQFKGFH